MLDFQKRIDYQGDLSEVVHLVCNDYSLGDYKRNSIIPVGYEDLNLKLETSQGIFFVKIFASFRTLKDCQNYIEVITKALEAGVSCPGLKKFSGGSLWIKELQGSEVRLCVMDWIEGNSFYDLGTYPNAEEIRLIAREAAKINTIDLKPEFVYDQWAIVNFPKELEKVRSHLIEEEMVMIDKLLDEWKELDIESLPHSLIHGDLISTNVLKVSSNSIMVIDFAVANYSPRVIELAILGCDLLFNPKDPSLFPANWSVALSAYQEILKLTEQELKVLPLFIKVAHTMHIIGAMREKTQGNNSEENEYWLNKGRVGLRYTIDAL
jgi:Ser/Thr protein kinase RdoA (MazF antagonist)